MTDPIVDAVCAKLQARSAVGIKKYGTTLAGNAATVKEKLVHIQEELMDAANYVEWLLQVSEMAQDKLGCAADDGDLCSPCRAKGWVCEKAKERVKDMPTPMTIAQNEKEIVIKSLSKWANDGREKMIIENDVQRRAENGTVAQKNGAAGTETNALFVENAIPEKQNSLCGADERQAALDRAYTQRTIVSVLLAKMALQAGYKAGVGKDNKENWDDEWKTILYVELPYGQISWHVAPWDRHMLVGLPEYHGAWDGTFNSRDPEFCIRAALSAPLKGLLDPDMPDQDLRLHMGEMTAQEVRTARAAIRWANTRIAPRVPAIPGLDEAIKEKGSGPFFNNEVLVYEAARWVAKLQKGG